MRNLITALLLVGSCAANRVHGQVADFSTSNWCLDSGTACWADSDTDNWFFRNAFSGIRLSADINLSYIIERGSNRFVADNISSLGKIGFQVNLFKGWVSFQSFLIVPGTLSLDSYSPLGRFAALPDTTIRDFAYRTIGDSVEAATEDLGRLRAALDTAQIGPGVRDSLKSAIRREIRSANFEIERLKRRFSDSLDVFYYQRARVDGGYSLRVSSGWSVGLAFLDGQVAMGAGRVYYDSRALPYHVRALTRENYGARSVFNSRDTFFHISYQPAESLRAAFKRAKGLPVDEVSGSE